MARNRADDAARVCVGVITGAHGVRGQVRIKTFTEQPGALGAYAGLVDDDGDAVALTVQRVRDADVIAAIDGIADRESAAAQRGRQLYVSRTDLPDLESDEFYHADLIGLRADNRDGSPFGTVIAVHNFGAGDLIEIADQAGKPVVVAFNRETVPEVDIGGGRIVVVPPPDLATGEGS